MSAVVLSVPHSRSKPPLISWCWTQLKSVSSPSSGFWTQRASETEEDLVLWYNPPIVSPLHPSCSLTILLSEASSGWLELLPDSPTSLDSCCGLTTFIRTISWPESFWSQGTARFGPSSGPVSVQSLLQHDRSIVLFGCDGRCSPADRQSWR